MAVFPQTKSGAMNGVYKNTLMANKAGTRDGKEIHLKQKASSGSAARFFYCAKASSSERNLGLEDMEKKSNAGSYKFREDGSLDGKPTQPKSNFHPTVKPIKLMKYLIRLVTPKGGVVLDPFLGSGTTALACIKEGMDCIGIEQDEDYCKIAEARIKAERKKNENNN